MARALIVGALAMLTAAFAARRLLIPLLHPHRNRDATATENLTPADQRTLSDTIRDRQR